MASRIRAIRRAQQKWQAKQKPTTSGEDVLTRQQRQLGACYDALHVAETLLGELEKRTLPGEVGKPCDELRRALARVREGAGGRR